MYTATALSFLPSFSPAPRGDSTGRHDQASTGYAFRSHSYSLAAWIPRFFALAWRKRLPSSSLTAYASLPASLRTFQSDGNSPTAALLKSSITRQSPVGACAPTVATPPASTALTTATTARRAISPFIDHVSTSDARDCRRPRRAGRSCGTRGRDRRPERRAASRCHRRPSPIVLRDSAR